MRPKFENTLVWFRNDLRLHDQEALYRAAQTQGFLVPVYCLDPRLFSTTSLGFPKTGAFRARFLLESLADLRQQLRKCGSDLIIRIGKPEDILPALVQTYQIQKVMSSAEVTYEEKQVEKQLEEALWAQKVAYETFWTSTLYHLEDLPYPIQSLPDIFTQFRKGVEKMVKIRPTLPAPAQLPALPPGIIPGELPSFNDLPLSFPEDEPKAVLDFKGGEMAALQRLETYFWQADALRQYKETRDGLLGANYSSKFSAWLAHGCLSPRRVYEAVRHYEQERVSNQSTYWLIFELIWRDYFRFVAKKYGSRIFLKKGIKNALPFRLYDNLALFEKWKNAQTGIPFIDANMRELNQTGFMSNRGRQNVASFLVKDLKINWTWGAAYFESQLIDYDACSNWGNWNYVAGVGNDPRENRYFNILSQAKRYDSRGEYVKHWLPELNHLPATLIHHPSLNQAEQAQYNVHLGSTYPFPMVKFEKWLSKS
ncbi:MAG: DASH family cryptochrome [Microscillaceae bacterium]|nr:DASH family cryptochrome [Microscillaceae bacterium]